MPLLCATKVEIVYTHFIKTCYTPIFQVFLTLLWQKNKNLLKS